MLRKAVSYLILIATIVAALPCGRCLADFESLLPESTKGFLSIANIHAMQASWDQMQLGQLAADPVMKPFFDDFGQQIKDRLAETGVRLGVDWDDVSSMAAGEIAVAVIEPQAGPQAHAMAIVMDVTGKDKEVAASLQKSDTTMSDRNAKRSNANRSGVEVTVYDIPPTPKYPAVKVVRFVINDLLIVVDHEEIALNLLDRISGKLTDGATLSNLAAFKTTMVRCAKDAGDLEPQARAFVEPLGFAALAKAAAKPKKRRSMDILKAMTNQGFGAVDGIGGFVNLKTDEHEGILRAFVSAPQPEQGERFNSAARILNFSKKNDLKAPAWAPNNLSGYYTAVWGVKESFEYVGSLVDEIAEDEGFFEDLLDSLKDDPNGPMLDIENDIIKHLTGRVHMITDSVVPVIPGSERFVIALEVDDQDIVADAITKAMQNDPDAREVEIERDGETLQAWEIIQEEEELEPELMIDGADIPGFATEEEEEEEEEAGILDNAAIAVVDKKLMISSHIDLIKDVVLQDKEAASVATTEDFQRLRAALTKVGAGKDTAFFFIRLREALRGSYELIRQGRMPESESLTGKMLNRLLGPEENGIVREQQIEGDKLPEFSTIEKSFGPGGGFLRTEKNGWFMVGTLVASRDQELAETADQSSANRKEIADDGEEAGAAISTAAKEVKK